MKLIIQLFILIMLTVGGVGCHGEAVEGTKPSEPSAAATRPNFLLVVVDDMGFADIEPFGSEIETPTLKRLAEKGVILTSFYAAPTCSPARAMLLSGMDNHIAGIGNMTETVADNQMGLPGYEGHLRKEVPTIAERLSENGYRTVMAGKWHLGMSRELSPGARGFDHALSFSFGGGSHFSDLMGPDVHRPTMLYRKNGELHPELAEDFYSTTSFTSELIEGLESTAHTGKPFFAYLALTAPHWPLQLPPDYGDAFSGRYDEGYDLLRQQRLAKQRELGLFDEAQSFSPRPPGVPAWDDLDEERRRRLSRIMEIYAGMIQKVDTELDRLLAYLDAKDLAEDTVIIFISDNGADSWDADHAPPAIRDHATTFDNSYENMGKSGSFTLFDRGWSWVSGTPFRGYKGSTFEGGIRVPAILSSASISVPGRISKETVSITDFAPTIMELAGIAFEESDFTGRSITPIMRNESNPIRSKDEHIGVEIWGRRAVKVGNWKAVRMPKPLSDDRWLLFDLDADPAEQNNLAEDEPETLAKLEAAWERYVAENNVVLPEGPFRILPPEPLPTD